MPNFNGGRLKWPAIIFVLLLAALLRLYNLDLTPPGFHYDEAFNAIQARDVLTGQNRPVFFVGNFGEEPMQMYLEAVIAAIAGESTWSARLSNFVFGILLIPALYFASRAFFPRNRLVGFGAAASGAIIYWAINFSRLGIEVNSLPWILTLCAGSLVLAKRNRSLIWSTIAGVLLGASLYTYLAARAFPVAVFLWFVYLLVLNRRELQLRNWSVVAACGLLVTAPLIAFFLANPLAFAGRAGQVVTPDQFAADAIRTAAMFVISGDTDPRDNLPSRPALDPFLSLLFLVGVAVAIRRAKDSSFGFLLIWLVVMTLPSALTEFAPNFRRAIGALPAVALLCGVGLDWLWTRFRGYQSNFISRRRAAFAGLVAIGFAFSAWSSAQAYFVDWTRTPGLFYSFDAGLLRVARMMVSRPTGEQLCLSPDYHDHPTVLWVLRGRQFSSFDGRRVQVIPDSALATTCAIITREDQSFLLPRFFSAARRLSTIFDLEGKPYADIIFVPAGATPTLAPQHLVSATIGRSVQLLGYDKSVDANGFQLNLYWRALAPLQQDYTVFVHLLAAGVGNEKTIASQDDAQAGHGSYPTSRWRTGETIIDRYSLSLRPDLGARSAPIEIGMYTLESGMREPVFLNGVRVPDDRILIEESSP